MNRRMVKPLNWLNYKLAEHNRIDTFVYLQSASQTLLNPQMEGSYPTQDASEIRVANGWLEWHTPQTYWPGVVRRFEAEPSPFKVHSGKTSQKQHMVYALSRGGIWQKIAVERGNWYEFSIWTWVYCSTRDDNISAGGDLHSMVGINPWGAGPTHYATVWGKECDKYDPKEGYDSWVQVKVVAQAYSDVISVCTQAMSQHTVKHNDVYWDDAEFKMVELGSGPEPEPDPPSDDFEMIVTSKLNTIQIGLISLSAELGNVPTKEDWKQATAEL